jgi:uncharacterized lipoprotein NlpE involved in copper resistance
MKNKSIITTSILSAAVMLSGCAATNPVRTDSNQHQEISHNTEMAAAKGCAVGAGAGVLLGVIHGNFANAIKLGIAGCVVGGVASGYVAYHEQLTAARELQQQAANEGLQATVATRQVQAKDNGQTKTTDALDRLTLPLDSKGVRVHAKSMGALLTKAAHLSDMSGTPVTIEVRGPAQDRAWMSQVIRSGLKDGSKTRLVETYATKTEVILSPIPDGKEGA